MNLSSIPPIITKSLSRTLHKNVADVTVSQQGNQRWQTSPAAPPGGLGHSPTF